jgi:hypothetical protein
MDRNSIMQEIRNSNLFNNIKIFNQETLTCVSMVIGLYSLIAVSLFTNTSMFWAIPLSMGVISVCYGYKIKHESNLKVGNYAMFVGFLIFAIFTYINIVLPYFIWNIA